MCQVMNEPLAPLSPAPPRIGIWAWLDPVSQRAFGVLNRWFMVPVHRLGLGVWIATPVGGHLLLIRVRGRKTGRIRDIPLSYLIADGFVWVLAGFGVRTQWYRNLVADPEVEVWLPGRVVRCRASEALDPAVRARIIPRLARSIGLPGAMIGCNPWTADDATILALVSWVPLIRLEPVAGPIAAGPDDPGGHAWLWRQAIVICITTRALRSILRCIRRSWGSAHA